MAYVGRGIDNISNASILDAITFTNSAGPYNLTQSSGADGFHTHFSSSFSHFS